MLTDQRAGFHYLEIISDELRGVRLKTKSSKRIIPIHPELQRLGFLDLVEARRKHEPSERGPFSWNDFLV